MEVNGVQCCSVSDVLRNIFVCVMQMKESQTGFEIARNKSMIKE